MKSFRECVTEVIYIDVHKDSDCWPLRMLPREASVHLLLSLHPEQVVGAWHTFVVSSFLGRLTTSRFSVRRYSWDLDSPHLVAHHVWLRINSTDIYRGLSVSVKSGTGVRCKR